MCKMCREFFLQVDASKQEGIGIYPFDYSQTFQEPRTHEEIFIPGAGSWRAHTHTHPLTHTRASECEREYTHASPKA